jgi:hypothetical protein
MSFKPMARRRVIEREIVFSRPFWFGARAVLTCEDFGQPRVYSMDKIHNEINHLNTEQRFNTTMLKRFGACEEVQALKVVDPRPSAVEQLGAMHDERKALRSADGDVESVWIE